jgi:hypothetical protein
LRADDDPHDVAVDHLAIGKVAVTLSRRNLLHAPANGLDNDRLDLDRRHSRHTPASSLRR